MYEGFVFTRLKTHVLNASLCAAVKFGDGSQVMTTIESGADVNGTDRDGLTPLILAVIRGHEECVRILLRKGASVNEFADDGATALFYSANTGNFRCLKILLEAGADVNMSDSSNRTPLWAAGKTDRCECLEALISAGADVNISCNDGFSVLMEASFEGHVRCVELLLVAGADVNYARYNGETALTLATTTCQYDIMKMLLRAGASVNTLNPNVLQQAFNFRGIADGDLLAKLRTVLYAAGENVRPPEELNLSKKEVSSLMNLCRLAVRSRLIVLNPKHNLFVRIPRLGLPWLLTSYLLYNVSLPTLDKTDEKDSSELKPT